jgi:hypothetical protein
MFDLSAFLFMFFVCILIFALVVTTLQNKNSKHYVHLGNLLGNMVDVLKMTMGDFEIVKRV